MVLRLGVEMVSFICGQVAPRQIGKIVETFKGLLTKDESGNWFHCGAPVKYSMCVECHQDGCFVTHCADWDCGWDFPDCVRDSECVDALLVLAVI
jgi:hypothetical protein